MIFLNVCSVADTLIFDENVSHFFFIPVACETHVMSQNSYVSFVVKVTHGKGSWVDLPVLYSLQGKSEHKSIQNSGFL